MRSLLTAFKTHMEKPVTTTALCFRITRSDSTVYSYTSYEDDLTFTPSGEGADVTFSAGGPAINYSDVKHEEDGSTGLFSIDGSYQANEITEIDLKSGRFDNASIELFLVNYRDLTQNTEPFFKAFIGDVSLLDNSYELDCYPMTHKLRQTVGRRVLPTCDAEFCDARCGLTLATYTYNATVAAVTSNREFTLTIADAATEVDNYLTYGKLTWTSGDNNGIEIEIKDHDYSAPTHTIKLRFSMHSDIASGDTCTVTAGCDKLFTTCQSFSNKDNFRGHPWVPGQDVMAQGVDA